jgi:excisionase family DNA binding protein
MVEICERLTAIEALLDSNGSPWLNLPEASNYTKVSPTTLRRWIEAGLLPGHRPNSDGKLLLHKKEIDAVLLFGKVKLTRPQREALKDLQ